jgi:hypothetical protein
MKVKIGEIFRRSWGYDQTNVDYFQVVALKAKTVVVREINHREVPGSNQGGMSCNVVPVKDSFDESKLPRQVKVAVGHEGSPVLVVGPKKWAQLVPANTDGTYPHSYCSWYA